MSVLSSFEICNILPGSNSWSDTLGPLHLAPGSPDWLSLSNSHPSNWVHTYTIDPVSDAGVYTVDVLNIFNSVVGQIEITVVECNPDYEYDLCVGMFTDNPTLEAPPTIDGDTWQIYSAPDWFELFSEPFNHSYQFVTTTPGTFWVLLQSVSDPNVFIRIQINVTTDCLEVADGCGPFFANIAWFNLVGGWSSYVFRLAKSLGNDTGESTTYKQGKVLKYASRKNVRDTVVQVSGYLPTTHIEFLRRLKNSIQAYEYNPDTHLWDIPIVIDQGEFEWKKQGSGLYKYDFKYSYGKEITIQNQ